ncbi:MAG: hypothetical protein HY831_04365 [Candidatus Aenigmarchaeota archaeon]|nr:hypothetical protein [Candidatus Aenigmarchaeota archaeon]
MKYNMGESVRKAVIAGLGALQLFTASPAYATPDAYDLTFPSQENSERRYFFDRVKVKSGIELKAYVIHYLSKTLGRQPKKAEIDRKVYQVLRDNNLVDLAHLRQQKEPYSLMFVRNEEFTSDVVRAKASITHSDDPSRIYYRTFSDDERYMMVLVNPDNHSRFDRVWLFDTNVLKRRNGLRIDQKIHPVSATIESLGRDTDLYTGDDLTQTIEGIKQRKGDYSEKE